MVVELTDLRRNFANLPSFKAVASVEELSAQKDPNAQCERLLFRTCVAVAFSINACRLQMYVRSNLATAWCHEEASL